jgi:DNA-binding NarL/FixJ family response regulator
MLTSYADEEAVTAAILAGASGYLLKQTRARALVDAIEVIVQGGSMLDPVIADQALSRIRAIAAGEKSPEARQLGTLTDGERRILPLLAEGKTNKEIAAVLFLSDKTVKNYVATILEKLGLARRTQAPAFAARLHQAEW